MLEQRGRNRTLRLISRMVDTVDPEDQQTPVLLAVFRERPLFRHHFVEMRDGSHVPHQLQALILDLLPVVSEDDMVREIAIAIQDRWGSDTPVVERPQSGGDKIVKGGHRSVPEFAICANVPQ